MATTETILEATIKAGVEHFSRDIKTAGLPLGHLFAWPFKTPPDGAIQCNGATYSRTLYGEFLAYVNSKGWLKTEGEWQSIASANGGYCPYYSNGDVSTYFRTPKFAPFMQVAIASGDVGAYHRAGAPEIQGSFYSTCDQWLSGNEKGAPAPTGAFKGTTKVNAGTVGGAWNSTKGRMINFKASDDNAIYGRSNTVQPESNEWMICVVVAGQATNIGSVDVGNVMSAVAQVQASVSAVEAKPILNAEAYVTETWSQGTSWYRKWSDGFMEQGGRLANSGASVVTCTFHKAFSTICLSAWCISERDSSGSEGNDYVSSITTSSCRFRKETGRLYWRALGY